MLRLLRQLLAAFAPLLPLSAAVNYPASPAGAVTDTYHGVVVADPYRWLEDVDSSATKGWVQAQNQVTFEFLRSLPAREGIKQRLLQLRDYPRYGLPSKRGGRYFYGYNTGLQNQTPLFVKESLDGEGRLLLDPNSLSTDGTVAIAGTAVSDDGKWMAYRTASAGSDWNEVRVLSVDTGRDTSEHLRWLKFSGTSWTKDNMGFFYGRYPAPPSTGNQTFSSLEHNKVYYHRLGAKQDDDLLIFESPDHPKWSWDAQVTDDGRYLLVSGSEGTSPRNVLYYADLVDPRRPGVRNPLVKLIDVLEADYTVIGSQGPVLFVRTDLDAPRRRIIAIDVREPGRANWKTLVAEGREVIQAARILGGRLVLTYLQDARSRVQILTLSGQPIRELALPGIGVASVTGLPDDNEMFFSFTSYVFPTTNYRHDLTTGKTEIFQAPKVDFNPQLYETRQVFFASKDGTKVPMFITCRKDLRLDRSNPTMLVGYGGFNVSQQPGFSPNTVAWLELGGVYAVANLRGGGEYGREWHLAGTKERKQNVFDDFIAAADHLVAQGYTSHDRLTLSGASNGGLLVAAVANQRPDIARVVLPAVGVMDMLRFHKFTIGYAWTSDYGNADDPVAFAYLSAYSPLHTIKPGATYPAVLVTTGDHDDRVHPGHSFKYAAAMQAANPTARFPTLIRVETNAGHGTGKPISKQIEETADRLAFALHYTGRDARH